MKKTNKEKQPDYLNKIYKNLIKFDSSFNQSSFFDYIVPLGILHDIDGKTKAKYIQNSERIPRKIRGYYKDKNNAINIKHYLEDWCKAIEGKREEIFNAVISTLDESIPENFKIQLKKMHSKKLDSEIYYSLFRFCFTGEWDIDLNTKKHQKHQQALKEFNEKILTEYGVSGKTGRTYILRLAKQGTQNPYILFEAAEIEFMKRYDAPNQNTENSLEKAYEYYKKASDLGFPLADWSIGYLAYICRNNLWYIKEFENMSYDEKTKIAIDYFQKAANGNCSKAFNSLGNIVKDPKLKPSLKKKLKSAKEYYYQAALRDNYWGMYHYARELEKELKGKINSNKSSSKEDSEKMQQTGKDMLNFFEKAAALEYPPAIYRCGLYYGHLEDNDTVITDSFKITEKDELKAYKYLERAIAFKECSSYFDALIYISEYILNDKNDLFWNREEALSKVEFYIEILEKNLIQTQKASERQCQKIEHIKVSYKRLASMLKRD